MERPRPDLKEAHRLSLLAQGILAHMEDTVSVMAERIERHGGDIDNLKEMYPEVFSPEDLEERTEQ